MKLAVFFALLGVVLCQFGDSSGFGDNSGFDNSSGFDENSGFPQTVPSSPALPPALPPVFVTFLDLTPTTSTASPRILFNSTPITSIHNNTALLSSISTGSTNNSIPSPGIHFVMPSLAAITRNEFDSNTTSNNTALIIGLIAVLFLMIALVLILRLLYFKYHKQPPPNQEDKFDLENQKTEKQEFYTDLRKQTISPPPMSVSESTWSSTSTIPKIKVMIPLKYQVESIKGPISGRSENSIFHTTNTITPTKTDSFFVSSFGHDLDTIKEDGVDADDDDEELYKVVGKKLVPVHPNNFYDYLSKEVQVKKIPKQGLAPL